MINCKDLTRMIASDELAEAGWWRRLAARVHLMMCVHCRRYQEQIRALGRAARDVLTGEHARIERRNLEELEAAIMRSAKSTGTARQPSAGGNGGSHAEL